MANVPNKHLMVDIETLGTDPGCAVVAIGAVWFDPEGNGWQPRHKGYYAEIFLNDALKYGYASPDTLRFWMGQSDEARQFLTNNDGKVTLREALQGLDSFIGHQSEADQRRDVYVWGNDDKFDMGNLEAMYRALDMPYPWNYGRSQNVRTIVWAARTFAGVDRPKMRQGRTAHNALDDAIHQAEYVTDMVKAILAGGKRDGDDR